MGGGVPDRQTKPGALAATQTLPGGRGGAPRTEISL